MITINGAEKEYILDFDKHPDMNGVPLVVSSVYGDNKSSWKIYMVTNHDEHVDVSRMGPDNLVVTVDLEKLKDKFYIYLVNFRKESAKITVMPNIEMSREKVYSFSIGKYAIDGNSVSFNVTSKVNGKNHPWEVSYSGDPLSYKIDKLKTKASITLESNLEMDFVSTIRLRQDRSGKVVTMRIYHNKDGSIDMVEAG